MTRGERAYKTILSKLSSAYEYARDAFASAPPRACATCGVPITPENCVYMPVDGGGIIGPLCDWCEESIFSPRHPRNIEERTL
jgi:hypothetical protein